MQSQAQTADHFQAKNGNLDAVVRVLASSGQSPRQVDRQSGVIHTDWRDTGFGYGFMGQQTPATIVRRFTIVVGPASGGEGSDVLVRMDARRCARGEFSIVEGEPQGRCEEMNEVPQSFQKDVTDLSQQLRASL